MEGFFKRMTMAMRHIAGYGLPDEELEAYARGTEELQVPQAEELQRKFDFRARVLRPGEGDPFLVRYTDIYYCPDLSNKRNCVVIVTPEARESELGLALPHELAHHRQLLDGFPFFIIPSVQDQVPGFARLSSRLDVTGCLYINEIPCTASQTLIILADFEERIRDFICECIIEEKGFGEPFHRFERRYGEFSPLFISYDIASVLPTRRILSRLIPIDLLGEHVRRMLLLDYATTEAQFRVFYPHRPLPDYLDEGKKLALKLNSFRNALRAYEEIVSLWMGVDYRSLRVPAEFKRLLFSLMNTLGYGVQE